MLAALVAVMLAAPTALANCYCYPKASASSERQLRRLLTENGDCSTFDVKEGPKSCCYNSDCSTDDPCEVPICMLTSAQPKAPFTQKTKIEHPEQRVCTTTSAPPSSAVSRSAPRACMLVSSGCCNMQRVLRAPSAALQLHARAPAAAGQSHCKHIRWACVELRPARIVYQR
jgi:hypothetical protein